MQKQYEKNVWKKSNEVYSMSIRVQTTINYISILFFLQQERELGKILRDTLTPAAWYGLLFTTQISQSDCEIRSNCGEIII